MFEVELALGPEPDSEPKLPLELGVDIDELKLLLDTGAAYEVTARAKVVNIEVESILRIDISASLLFHSKLNPEILFILSRSVYLYSFWP